MDDSATQAIVYMYNQQAAFADQQYELTEFCAWLLKMILFVAVIGVIAVVGLLRPRRVN